MLAVVQPAFLLLGRDPHGDERIHQREQSVAQRKGAHGHGDEGGHVLAKRLKLPGRQSHFCGKHPCEQHADHAPHPVAGKHIQCVVDTT